MKTIRLNLKRFQDFSYPLFIGSGHFRQSLRNELEKIRPSKIAVIIDSNLIKLYRDKLLEALAPFQFTLATYAAGEENKNISTILDLFSQLSKAGLDRKSIVVAFGGGVTGDMAGFLSSIYLRGIPFIQVPTSLLAVVDSSIGGKTGVDTPEGKNLMGSFYQPKSVIIDTDFLKSLPPQEFTNGMAEVLKHAFVMDKKYYRFLVENKASIDSLDGETLSSMIETSCRIKRYVVQKDEKEKNIRQILNFGHTIGHAIESASDYRIPHGFSVAIGMVAEAKIAASRGVFSQSDVESLKKTLENYGLLKFKDMIKTLNTERILRSAQSDKKNVGSAIKIVMLKSIGNVYREKEIYSFAVMKEEILNGLLAV